MVCLPEAHNNDHTCNLLITPPSDTASRNILIFLEHRIRERMALLLTYIAFVFALPCSHLHRIRVRIAIPRFPDSYSYSGNVPAGGTGPAFMPGLKPVGRPGVTTTTGSAGGKALVL